MSITLDVEMPEMDGLETLQPVCARIIPRLPVIMFSTLTRAWRGIYFGSTRPRRG